MGKPKPHRDDDLRSRILKLEAELTAMTADRDDAIESFNRVFDEGKALATKLEAMTKERDDWKREAGEESAALSHRVKVIMDLEARLGLAASKDKP